MASQVARDLFVTGLKDAHAIEVQARELMERQSGWFAEFPDMEVRARQHLGETEMQLRRLENCLDAAGESTSVLKDTALSAVANLTATVHAMAGDEILKNTFANGAFENYEIAAYKSLLALCDRAGFGSAAEPLKESLREEERMAQWIDGHIEDVTLIFLAKAESARTYV